MGLNLPASTKLFGINLTPKQSHGVGMANVDAFWALFLEWDWNGWIKPQIDFACGNDVGCNCVRLIGSLEGVFAGKYSQATYNAHWQQLVDYCAGLGVYVEFTGGFANQVSAASASYNQGLGHAMTDQDIADGINATLAALTTRTNIIGVDAMQEQNAWGAIANGYGGLFGEVNAVSRTVSIYNKIKAGGTTLPVGFSVYDVWASAIFGGDWIAAISAAVDYLDLHVYTASGAQNPATPAGMNFWRGTYPSLDLLIGEFGTAESNSYDAQVTQLSAVLNAVNVGDAKIKGAAFWASGQGDTTASNDWGMYDAAFATPRLAKQRLMREFTGGSVARANRTSP